MKVSIRGIWRVASFLLESHPEFHPVCQVSQGTHKNLIPKSNVCNMLTSSCRASPCLPFAAHQSCDKQPVNKGVVREWLDMDSVATLH